MGTKGPKTKKSKKKSKKHVESDSSDDVQWVEKTMPGVSTSSQINKDNGSSKTQREGWMIDSVSSDQSQSQKNKNTSQSGVIEKVDSFAKLFGLNSPVTRKSVDSAPPRDEFALKVHPTKELNPYFRDGGNGLPPPPDTSARNEKTSPLESPMSHFSMKKLQRVYNIAAEENRPVEEVALERFGSMEMFNMAVNERNQQEGTSKREDESLTTNNKKTSYLNFTNSTTNARTTFARPVSVSTVDNTVDRQENSTKVKTNPNSSDSIVSNLLVTMSQSDSTRFGASSLSSQKKIGDKRKDNEKDDEHMSIDEMIRQEKMNHDDNMDQMLANKMSRDGGFQDTLDYMDENMDKLVTTHRTHDKRRKVAIEDLARQQQSLVKCQFCYKDNGATRPAYPVIALGVKTYLALVPYESVAKCMIVPVEHSLSSLEEDDATWGEIRNFMKCLMRMYDAVYNQQVLFMESVIELKWQRHTVIEVVPVPREIKSDAPAYFREALLSVDSEWTQHTKVIDTEKKGFRNSLVCDLPYFHVWFTLDGGYGHVIEEREKFSEWFGKETIGQVMDVEPNLYRKQRWLDRHTNHSRVRAFVQHWEAYDWTKMLEGGEYVNK